MEKQKVLFICRDNSARSLIAASFLNTYFGGRYEASAAGIEPLAINPLAMKVMKEIGIDISSCKPKGIRELGGNKFDCIITLCDYAKKFQAPLPAHKKHLHKSFKDYCLSSFCKSAGNSDVCIPRYLQRQGKTIYASFDRELNEEEAICSFRNLREDIFEWIEKEAVF